MACIVGLAGCENLADLEIGLREKLNEAFSASGEPANGEPVLTQRAADEKEVPVTLDRPAAKNLQRQLAALGFRPGPADGIPGKQTARAIKRYQAAHGLPATGRISLQLMEHLELLSAGGTDKAPSSIKASIKPPGDPSPAGLTEDDFPTYLPGTSFVYSNGTTERVLRVKNLITQWAEGDGATYSAHRNFLLPKTYWASNDERGTAIVASVADDLWPVREGAEVSFSARITTQSGDNSDTTRRRVDRWQCRNDGSRTITVKAGTFETLVLVCRLGDDPASPELVRTWYYAKSVRHYVRFVESQPQNDTSTTVDLVAIRPGAPTWPPIMRAALARAVVHALEMEGDTSRMPWTSSGVNTQVTIEAKSRFVADDGRPCRRFEQIWSAGGARRHYPAVACKTAKGKWTIPGLESNTAHSLATSGKVS